MWRQKAAVAKLTSYLSMTLELPIAVLGAGAWGTALAVVIANNQHRCLLWGRDAGHIQALSQERVNARHLPGVGLPTSLEPTADLAAAVAAAGLVVVAVPSKAFRECLSALHPHLREDVGVLWVCKGLDSDTGEFLSQAAGELLGNHPCGVLSGPSFASELARGLPTAVTVAATESGFAKQCVACLSAPYFRLYTNDDLIGVQLGGVVKNVMAIATGICDGMSYGANARAALITRGLAELVRLGIALGAKPETLQGLSGLGDLILSCTDDQSRNRQFGLALGQGMDLAAATQHVGKTVEGVYNARQLYQLAQQYQVDTPIIEQVCQVLDGSVATQQAVERLMNRELGSEV